MLYTGWRATNYDCLFQRILTTDNTVVELSGNWDLVKRWLRSNHNNTWDGHLVKNRMVTLRVPSVVMLKGGNGFCNDPRLGITPAACRLILLYNQKYHGVEVDETYIHPCRSMGISADGKRDVVASAKDCAQFIKTGDFEGTFREVVNSTFLSRI